MVAVSYESGSADSWLHWPRFVGGAHFFAGGLRRWSLRGAGGVRGGAGVFRDCRLHFTVDFVPPSFSHPRRSEETARFLIKWFCVVPALRVSASAQREREVRGGSDCNASELLLFVQY